MWRRACWLPQPTSVGVEVPSELPEETDEDDSLKRCLSQTYPCPRALGWQAMSIWDYYLRQLQYCVDELWACVLVVSLDDIVVVWPSLDAYTNSGGIGQSFYLAAISLSL